VNPDLIIDVGMHLGEDTEFYLRKGFRVVAIEANPDLCELVRRRLARFVESGQLTIVNTAIAERAGPITFFVNELNSAWGTANALLADRHVRQHNARSREMRIDAVTFDSILEEFGIPYYLKIDIEGSDILCLRAFRERSSKPKFVSLETESTSFDDVFDAIALLRTVGYHRFKVVQQDNIARTKPPFPSREKEFVPYEFPDSASGLFGNELPGEWLDTEGVIRQFVKLFPRYRLFSYDRIRSRILRGIVDRVGLSPGWHDIHAMRD
jgi:FkbM family methyltransferase